MGDIADLSYAKLKASTHTYAHIYVTYKLVPDSTTMIAMAHAGKPSEPLSLSGAPDSRLTPVGRMALGAAGGMDDVNVTLVPDVPNQSSASKTTSPELWNCPDSR